MRKDRTNRNFFIRKDSASVSKPVRRTALDSSEVSRSGIAARRANVADDIQYVLPLGNGWVVKAAKSKTFTVITDSKREAVSIARAIARTKHTKLIVHGRNGAIQMKESYVA